MKYINIDVWVGIKYDYHCACNHACVCIFLSPPLLSIQYTCCRLRKSPGFEPPERERLSDRSRVSLKWVVSVMVIQWWDKKPSLSLS